VEAGGPGAAGSPAALWRLQVVLLWFQELWKVTATALPVSTVTSDPYGEGLKCETEPSHPQGTVGQVELLGESNKRVTHVSRTVE